MGILVNTGVAARAVRSYGPFAAAIPDAFQGAWTVTFTKGASWPASGEVLVATIEESADNGQTWQFSAGLRLSGGDWPLRGGGTTNTGTWVTTPMHQGTGRRIRASIDVLQACDLGVAISV